MFLPRRSSILTHEYLETLSAFESIAFSLLPYAMGSLKFFSRIPQVLQRKLLVPNLRVALKTMKEDV